MEAMPAIEIYGAHKTYRRRRRPPEHAVRGLDMVVESGGVFGFLGPNGSGKTTTIRLLLGLIRADAGRLTMLGQPVPERLPQVIGRIGALVEAPLFLPAFSGRQNLSLLASASGIDQVRVQQLLDLVGLFRRADDRVKTYSLGMKQRLGIASALLKNPELLILDEPGNGLDAAGTREMRELIKHLGAGGVTVLLSSHQLSEVQQICDRVAIMSHGQVIAAGSVAELLAAGSSGELRLQVSDPAAGRAVLQRHGFTVTSVDGALHVLGASDPGEVTKALSDAGLYLTQLTSVAANLESVFLDLTAAPSGGAAVMGASDTSGEVPSG